MVAGFLAEALQIDNLVVDFAGGITTRSVDAVFAEAYARRQGSAANVVLDFSGTTFIEAPACQMIIASALSMKRNGDEIRLRVPLSQKVRDFWRAWGFPQALAEALGLDAFGRMVPIEDKKYFGEPRRYYLPAELPAHPGFSGDTVRSSNFFGFYAIHFPSGSQPIRLAYEEKDHWNVSHIHAVLRDKLGRDSTYFPSRVVFEAVLNALRHPGATLLQTAATDQRTKEGRQFTVHFWDDGVSMAETLREAVERGAQVRGSIEEDLSRTYLVVESSDDDEFGTKEQRVETTAMLLEKGINEQNALFATLMPGVSSDMFGPGHAVPGDVLDEDIRFGRRGMGLFVLLNAAVEILKGSVAFRTGHYFMNVRQTNAAERRATGATLRVRLKRRPSLLPEFVGNLITVRVPYQPDA